MSADAARWLLELTAEGRVYRWSEALVELDAVQYQPGLTIDAVQRDASELSLEILDPSLDWPVLASALPGSPITLRRHVIGQPLSDAEIYVSGLVVGLEHGARYEPVSISVGRPDIDASVRGAQVPDPLAQLSRGTHGTATVDVGAYYPTLFGTPGHDGTAQGVAAQPVPLLFWTAGSGMWIVLGEQLRTQSLTDAVRIRNEDLGTSETYTPETYTDLLGRTIWIARTASADVIHQPTVDAGHRYTAAWLSQSCGGSAATAWEVIEYLLTRYGEGSADWPRLRRVADRLALYRVDSWIDDVVQSPWDWIEETLVEQLPVEVQAGPRGLYLVEQRYRPDGTRHRGSVTEGEDAVRDGARTWSAPGPNELTARYRSGLDGEYLARVIMTGDLLQSTPIALADPGADDLELARVVRDARCVQSYARWGLRQAPVVDVEWTWDTGTALAVLDWMADRDTLPAWEAVYWIYDGHDLEIGDELELTDDELGLSDQPIVIMEPPIADRTRWARVRVRYDARG